MSHHTTKQETPMVFFLATKVVSAIINVGQDVGEHPWPLDILDHSGEAHKVYLEPGDLVWYESAR